MASRTALSSKDTVGIRRAVLSQIAISRFSSVENKTSHVTINIMYPTINIIYLFVSVIYLFVSVIYLFVSVIYQFVSVIHPFASVIHPFVSVIYPFTANLQYVEDHYLFFQRKRYNKINCKKMK